MNWLAAAAGIIASIRGHSEGRGGLSPEHVATALYRGILDREPDLAGLAQKADSLRSGEVLERVIRSLIGSPEFHSRFLQSLLPSVSLPNLIAMMPDRYDVQQKNGGPVPVYLARHDADMTLMASLIEKHRFYDRFGVWSPVIDLDKQVTAAIVRGLGSRSCFELGCFTGPVMSLLAEAGISVCGTEVSHLAFVFAYPNVRDAMIFGDLLAVEVGRTFDAVLCMDVLEHLNPSRLDDYIQRLLSLLDADGYVYVNSPMWGEDRIFGSFEDPYLAEWHAVGDDCYWRHWPCDGDGWPAHGHLVWASPGWWERKFAEHGLVRDEVVEASIHRVLGALFNQTPGRRCLFVLHRPNSGRSSAVVAAEIEAELLKVPELPTP